MKKYRKIISLLMILTLALAFSACSKQEPAEEPDDGQNPIMNFIGDYVCDRADILIEAADEVNGAKATVTWGSSAAEHSEWTMSGTYDDESHVFTYADCVRKNIVLNEDGSVASEEEVYNDGTGTMTFSEGNEGPYLEWKDDKENMADGMTFTFNRGTDGMPNPWSDVDSAEEAAEGAGVESFVVPEGTEISLGEVKVEQYRCMDGLAEAIIPIAAVEMTVRKGKDSAADVAEGDISGDYGEYKYDWNATIDGREVRCFGNRKGEATKSIWSDGDYFYSITAFGAGGDDDFGLSADDLNVLVSGIK